MLIYILFRRTGVSCSGIPCRLICTQPSLYGAIDVSIPSQLNKNVDQLAQLAHDINYSKDTIISVARGLVGRIRAQDTLQFIGLMNLTKVFTTTMPNSRPESI